MKTVNIFYCLVLTFVIGQYGVSQINLGYQQPPKEILDLVDAPLPPLLELNSSGTSGVLLYRKAFKSIEELSQPELRLAGLRINPKTNIYSRLRTYYEIRLLDVKTRKAKKIENLPQGQYSNFQWSRDESKIAMLNTEADGVSLWVVDLEQNRAEKITQPILNANMGTPYIWLDAQSFLIKMLPDERSPLVDRAEIVPRGPVISENTGKKAQNRTYQDLLKTPTDEMNFETLAQSVLYKVDLDGTLKPWKEKNMYRRMSVSPDGQYVLVSLVQRPFSYLVPYSRFPTETDVYLADGSYVTTVEQMPLIEDLPSGFNATHTYKRNIGWRDDKPATLYWVQALDEGNPVSDTEFRDGLYTHDAPFDGDEKHIASTKNRFSSVEWGNDEVAVVSDRWFSDRNTKSYLINPLEGPQSQTVIFDRNYQDRYSDPGDFVTSRSMYGTQILEIEGSHLYLEGPGYSDAGVHPFIDRINVLNGETERIYQSNLNEQYERIRSVMDIKKGKVLVSIEAPATFPNYYLRDLKSGQLVPLTAFDNPFQSLENVHKEVIQYQREDGVDLSGTLYLPPGYDKSSGQKLPMLLWAYPVEYKDKGSAGQLTSSPYQFTYPSYGSPVFWVIRGYAVLDRAAFPIIGEGDNEPNDSFRKQLVANGKAAIDAVDALGYVDRGRVGVGGHSYGAFMTANLLSHSDLFAAGIARSGAYNRTLTPFGFQREERSYWEAPDIYYAMSPFMHAEKMKTPLLLLHGEADNNSGTYPMQSERYFNALKGLGATVRLVMLPKESHGYAARESILHMLWEQDQWLEKFVKEKDMQDIQP